MWAAGRKLPFENIRKRPEWTLLFLFIATTLFYFLVFVNPAEVEISIKFPDSAGSKVPIRIYYAGDDRAYGTKQMAGLSGSSNHTLYHFRLANLKNIKWLRVDPHNYVGEAVLQKLTIKQVGYKPLLFDSAESFAQLQPRHDIAQLKIESDGLHIISDGKDPFLELAVGPLVRAPLEIQRLALGYCFVLLMVWLVWYCGRRYVADFSFVPVLLFGALILAFSMAVTSENNAHPDEYVHIAAVNYYKDHWLPPKVDDPSIRNTFSGYGESRLIHNEIYYLVAGKCSKVSEFLDLRSPLNYRISNLALLGLIFLFAMRSVSARIVAIPLLISPQIWYLFSYCNSDAFSLFMTWIAAWQFVDSKSFLNKVLFSSQQRKWEIFAGLLIIGVCFGVLLLVKKIYIVFTALLLLALILKIFFGNVEIEKKTVFLRCLTILFVGGVLFSGKISLNYVVNGSDFKAKKAAIKEEYAFHQYKNATPLEEKNIFLQLRARGKTFKQMYYQTHWFEQSFESAFGMFGYFNIQGGMFYYNLMKWVAGITFAFFVLLYLYHGNYLANSVAVAAGVAAAMLIALSFYHSWTSDFQPQGRYLFPILSMLGLLCGLQSRVIRAMPVVFGLIMLYLFSTWFFVAEGMVRIQKYIF